MIWGLSFTGSREGYEKARPFRSDSGYEIMLFQRVLMSRFIKKHQKEEKNIIFNTNAPGAC